MFITHDLEKSVLYDPAVIAGRACDHLLIVTGFADCDMMAQHVIQLHDEQGSRFSRHIAIDIILGMYKGASLNLRKHQKIMQTLNRLNTIDRKKIHITCRYICADREVHSKVYTWLKDGVPAEAFAGSANYTINAFRRRREMLTDCAARDSWDYYNELLSDTVDCFNPAVPDLLHLSTAETTNDEILPDNAENLDYQTLKNRTPVDVLEVSWLTAKGTVGFGSGPNWGIRPNGTKRDRNQAYIPYNKSRQKAGFFPDRKNPADKNCPLFKAVTSDGGLFYMRMAQANNKGIHTAESNALLGKWLRKKLGAADGAFVTEDDFKRYGKTSVTFYKYADDVFIMDF